MSETIPPLQSQPQQIPGPHPNEFYDDTELLARIDTLEKNNKHLTKIVEFVQNTNGVVLLVLALGFVALLVTVIGMVLQSLNERSNVQIELIKSIESLKTEINQKTVIREVIEVPQTSTQSSQSPLISN